MGRTPAANSDGRLHPVLERLEACRRVPTDCRGYETADPVSIGVLDLRMRFGRTGGSELRALCEEILR